MLLVMVPLLVCFLFTSLTSTFSAAAAADTYNISRSGVIAKPGCPSKCGNLTVPFPFGIGIGSGCALNSDFEVNCIYTSYPAFMGDFQIFDISDNRMRTSTAVSRNCYDGTGSSPLEIRASLDIKDTPFSFSDLNKFTIIGCDEIGQLVGGGSSNLTGGCVSVCSNEEEVADGVCSGKGCCQTSIIKGGQYYITSLSSLNNHTSVSPFNPCGYSFVGEQGSFEFRATDVSDSNFMDRVKATVPVVMDWAIGNMTCQQAMESAGDNYKCMPNSYCVDSNTGLGGYRCICDEGYIGNPYIDSGCTVDLCSKPDLHDCVEICVSSVDSFNCSCPDGEYGDGRKSGTGCTPRNSGHHFPLIKVAVGVGLGFVWLVIVVTGLYFYIKKRYLLKVRGKFFKRNGGLILKQRICLKDEGSIESTKVFTAEELMRATNSYAENRIIGRGAYGTVYKGILPDKSMVAVKRSTIMDESQIEQFINEVIILTQINHRNVVKLLGCCLESEVPILVYEYVSNGTLFEYIHNKGPATNWLSWENRLRIASEAAGALSYLHSAASTPIIHRDVKSTNILLDAYYTAKISDFGASRLIPLDQNKVTTMVIGTFGYLDPEYFHTSHLTEKSDVYSFGVVLIELLTGRKPVDMARSEDQRSLTACFVTHLKESRLFQILDARVVREGSLEQLQAMGELVKRCLHLNREKRPTMKEVATELEALRKFTMSTRTDNKPLDRETEGGIGLTDLYTVSVSPL